MARIFVSYARADATQLADDLADELRTLKYDVFLDKQMPVGVEWEKIIHEQAKKCDLMVTLVTSASNQSQAVYREFGFAKKYKKNILPVIVNQTPLPVHLQMYQAVNYNGNNLDTVLLQITRIVPQINTNKWVRRIKFAVSLAIIIGLILGGFLFFQNQLSQWFCGLNDSCATATGVVQSETNTPELMNEPSILVPTVTVTPSPVPTDTPTQEPDTPVLTNTVMLLPRLTVTPSSPTVQLTILDGSRLLPNFSLGVDASSRQRNWVSNQNSFYRLGYPSGQQWGIVYITVGTITEIGEREALDLSDYETLAIDLRGETGNEVVSIGVKDNTDPDNGFETKIRTQLDETWQTYEFSLSQFATADFTRIYIPVEIIFAGNDSQIVYFRNVYYIRDTNGD